MPDQTVEVVHRDDLHAFNIRMSRDEHRMIYSTVPDPDNPGFYLCVVVDRIGLETRPA